jgi:D-3-phosphoglycerate dehydrogenase
MRRIAAAAIVTAGLKCPPLAAPNVIATPHIGGQTVEAIDRMGTVAVAEVLRVLRGEPPRHAVPPPDEQEVAT